MVCRTIRSDEEIPSKTLVCSEVCLQLKRPGTEYAAQEIDFSTSTVAEPCTPINLYKIPEPAMKLDQKFRNGL